MHLRSHTRRPAVVAGLLVVSIVLLAVAAPVGADAPDAAELPCSLWGSIEIDGASVAASTPIRAYVGSTVYATAYAAMDDSTSVYAVDVPADDPSTTTVREGGAEGDVVRFKVGDAWCRTSALWHSGGVVELDLAGPATKAADIDGDGRMDVFTWRPDGGAYGLGVWLGLLSTQSYNRDRALRFQENFGIPGDVPLMGDMDADGMVDLFTWRPYSGGVPDPYWYGWFSSTGFDDPTELGFCEQWGSAGDVPLLSDMDGDGSVDVLTWRPSNGYWYGLLSSKGYSQLGADIYEDQWGMAGDTPLLGDMDGDGLPDVFTWRPEDVRYDNASYWFGLLSTKGYDHSVAQRFQVQWGLVGDIPLLGDMDGDGKVDVFTWRPSTGYWYGLLSTNNYDRSAEQRFQVQWGLDGDTPVLADMDGDDKVDVFTWRPSTGYWYGLLSTHGYDRSAALRYQEQWGTAGDVALP